MTVTPPDFDPEMTGHSAVLLDGTIHALVSKYDEDGHYDATEWAAESVGSSDTTMGGEKG
jgi:hypothetical protein